MMPERSNPYSGNYTYRGRPNQAKDANRSELPPAVADPAPRHENEPRYSVTPYT